MAAPAVSKRGRVLGCLLLLLVAVGLVCASRGAHSAYTAPEPDTRDGSDVKASATQYYGAPELPPYRGPPYPGQATDREQSGPGGYADERDQPGSRYEPEDRRDDSYQRGPHHQDDYYQSPHSEPSYGSEKPPACQGCPPGSGCVLCPEGTYSPGNPSDTALDSTPCLACANFYETKAPGATSFTECVPIGTPTASPSCTCRGCADDSLFENPCVPALCHPYFLHCTNPMSHGGLCVQSPMHWSQPALLTAYRSLLT